MLQGKAALKMLFIEFDLGDDGNGSHWKDSVIGGILATGVKFHHLGVRGLGEFSSAMLTTYFQSAGQP